MVKKKSSDPVRARGKKSSVPFSPPPLPPDLDITLELSRSLSDADRLVGRLGGVGGLLPNPDLLIRPFIQREAVHSSKIEGTQATLGEVLAVEAGVEVERSPDDLREVWNYVIALEHGVERLMELPISLRLVCEVHKRLMTGVRGETADPGQFRKIQNWIGAPGSPIENATFIPPPPEDMKKCLSAWEKFLHDRQLPPLIQIALAHYQFEAIHPFIDGNGRIGRLIITLFLIERKILPSPLLYLSAFFEATKDEYYSRLRRVTEQGEWGDWIIYFLNGVARQSEDAISRAERINTVLSDWRRKVAGAATKVPMQLIDILAENPICTIKSVSKRLGVAFTTAQRGIEKLQKAEILTEVTKSRRDRVYHAKKLIEILEEPARLTPLETC